MSNAQGAAGIETRGLTKAWGDCVSVSGVSLNFEPGLIHAVLGENGAGKSTLMKLLFGLHRPTEGEILIDGEKVEWASPLEAIARGLGMVQQHFTLVDKLSAIDNIMLGAEVASMGKLDRKKAIELLEKRLPTSHLAVPWHAKVEDLTVGQKQKVEILKLLFRDSKVLFLDEPTAVLTPGEIEEFFAMLKSLKAQGRTIVLITHKIGEVLSVCDTYTVLRQGKLIARGRVAGASAESIVESMIGRKLPSITGDRPAPRAEVAIECAGLREREHARGSLKEINLRLRRGEIVGVAGVEGAGQSNFVEAVMGLRDFEGELSILGREMKPLQAPIVRDLGTGLVPEDRHHQGLWLDESCYTNMAIGLEDQFLKHNLFQQEKLETVTGGWATEYDVRAASLETSVGRLSGGNQQKLLFAREVTGRKPKLLVCHQPTRGVDLGAIDLIHRKLISLRNEGVAILVLSSELDELMTLSDRIYVFYEGKVSAELERSAFDRFAIGAAMTGVTRG